MKINAYLFIYHFSSLLYHTSWLEARTDWTKTHNPFGEKFTSNNTSKLENGTTYSNSLTIPYVWKVFTPAYSKSIIFCWLIKFILPLVPSNQHLCLQNLKKHAHNLHLKFIFHKLIIKGICNDNFRTHTFLVAWTGYIQLMFWFILIHELTHEQNVPLRYIA